MLSATWTDNGKKVDNVTFENTYTADKTTTTTTPGKTTSGKTTSTKAISAKATAQPKTGDNSSFAYLFLLLAASGITCEELIRRRKKNGSK